MRRTIRAALWCAVGALVVAVASPAIAGATDYPESGGMTLATAPLLRVGDRHTGTPDLTHELMLEGLTIGHLLFRLPTTLYGRDVVNLWVQTEHAAVFCVVPEARPYQPCSSTRDRVVTQDPVGRDLTRDTNIAITVTSRIERPILRVEPALAYGRVSLRLLSFRRPLALTPYIFANHQITDFIRLRANADGWHPAGEGLPCQALVVGPGREDRFTYRSTVKGGWLNFDIDLPDRLHGKTVGYLVTCDGSPLVSGSSFEVVVK